MSSDEPKEPWLEAFLATLKEGPLSDPAGEERVMARVRAEASRRAVPRGVARWVAPLHWFFRPRRIMISPLGLCASGLAIVLIVAGGAWISIDRSGTTSRSQVPVHESVNGYPVLFTLLDARASRVSIVGDFNNWNPAANPLHREGEEGIWAGVFMLPVGIYSYAYDVDGKIRVFADTRPAAPADEFGIGRSILVVREESI